MTTHAGRERRDRPWVAFAALVLMLATLVVAAVIAAPPARSQGENGARFVGVASCAGSTCHGRMEGDGQYVRQDELMKWQEPSTPGGAHSRAWAVLGNSRSQVIARNLGLKDAATAPMCLGCHSDVAKAGASAVLADGVSCESCHGPAGGWLASHYAGVGTTADPDRESREKHLANIRAGLAELENPVERAEVCVDCHFGKARDGQFVTHRIMAAGHPRISFELDLFSSLQAHHQEDEDYGWRKFGVKNARTDHVQMWAVGQAVALERSLQLFQSKRGTEGMFPEFYFLDCHSCHRRIYDQAKPVKTSMDNPGRALGNGLGWPEGMPPYNDENLIMLSAAARIAAPGLADQLAARTAAFHRAMTVDRASAAAAAAQLGQTVAALKGAFASRNFSGADAFALVDAISAKALGDRLTDYSGSQQAVMGVDTLLNSMVSSGRITVGAAAGIRGDIDRAYAAVKDPNAYKPAEFQASLGSAVRAIRALR
jgi:hypothetical protein